MGYALHILIFFLIFRLAGVLDLSKESQKADELVENARFNDDETTTRKRSSSAARHKQQYAALSRGKSVSLL